MIKIALISNNDKRMQLVDYSDKYMLVSVIMSVEALKADGD